MARYDFVYVTHARLPTEKAHGVQIAQSMYAFSRHFKKTKLVRAMQPNTITHDLFEYYGFAPDAFEMTTIPSLAFGFLRRTRFGYWVRSITFSFFSFFYVLVLFPRIIYSREPLPLLFFTFLPMVKTVYETHDFPQSYHGFHKFLFRRVGHIVATNQWAKDMCIKEYGISESHITVAPNGYNESLFHSESTDRERSQLSLPTDTKIVLYSGNLFKWKGVHILLQAAQSLSHLHFVIVGGDDGSQRQLQKEFPASNVTWRPHVTQDVVAEYLRAADVLVLPNVPLGQHATYSTSPIKLFEYMATGKPVVASDLHAIRTIVSDEYITYVPTDAPEALATALDQVCTDYATYQAKADRARTYGTRFTWQERTKRIKDTLCA